MAGWLAGLGQGLQRAQGPWSGIHSLKLLKAALGVPKSFTKQLQACIPQRVVIEM